MSVTTRVAVLGGGTMGVGIAVVAARAGFDTVMWDVDDSRVEAGQRGATAFLSRSVELGKLSPEAGAQALQGLRATSSLSELADVDIVIEAVVEDLEVKKSIFASLDDIIQPDALIHTNTSTLSVTAIASGSRVPERVIGTHYCNPAPLMKLVEVARGLLTSDETHRRSLDYLHRVGKQTVDTADSPGFIINRFLLPWENNCIRALEAGLGTVESIDLAVKRALGHPMGPFELLDTVGLDVHKKVSDALFVQLRDPRFAAPPLVDQMIAAGRLGRKTGEGFYTYEKRSVFGG